jgi:hypothetical protein
MKTPVVSIERIEALTYLQQQVFWLLPTRYGGKPGNMSQRVIAIRFYNVRKPTPRQMNNTLRVLKSLLAEGLAFRGNVTTWYRASVEGVDHETHDGSKVQ